MCGRAPSPARTCETGHAWLPDKDVEASLVARLCAGEGGADELTTRSAFCSAAISHRLAAVAAVAAAWTAAAGEAGLAPALLDGRADALVEYVAAEEEEEEGACPSVLDLPASSWHPPSSSSVWAALSLHRRPAIIRGGAASWTATQTWADADGAPLMRAFAAAFPGATPAKVTDCCCPDVRRPSTVGAFVAWWEGGGPADPPPLLYLKDVQMRQAHPEGFLDDAIGVACLEDEDWLGAAAVETAGSPRPLPSYRFVYAGPAGAATPVHCDVMRSNAWAANVAGTKRWLLVPPGRAHFLYDRTGTAVAPWLDGGGVGGRGPAPPWRPQPHPLRFPWLDRVRPVEVIQGPGDVIFVPSGWWHSVENLTPSISLNANFLDAACACDAWDHVKAEHAAAAVREGGGVDAALAAAAAASAGGLPPPPVDGTTLAACDGIGLAGFLEVCSRAAGRAMRGCEEAGGLVSRTGLARAGLTAAAAADILEDALQAVASGELGPGAACGLDTARLAGVVERARAGVEAARAVLSVASLRREC